jgi:hypothetical protein
LQSMHGWIPNGHLHGPHPRASPAIAGAGMLMYLTIPKTQRIGHPGVAAQKSASFLAASSKCGPVSQSRRASHACNPRHFVGLRPTIGWRENIDTS